MFQELFISKGLILKCRQALVSRERGTCLSIKDLLKGRKRQRGFSKIDCDRGAEVWRGESENAFSGRDTECRGGALAGVYVKEGIAMWLEVTCK